MNVSLVAGFDPSLDAPSGVQSYTISLARYLSKRGFQVDLLGVGASRGDFDDFDFYSVLARPGNAWDFTWGLAKFVRRNRTAWQGIVHAQRPDDLLPFQVLSRNAIRVVTMHGIHAIHVRLRRGRLMEAAYRSGEYLALRRVDAVIGVSPDTTKRIVSAYPFLQSRLWEIPAGINLEKFNLKDRVEARRRLSLPVDQRIVTFVGRFEPEKNLTGIVKAFKTVSAKHGDAMLVLCGSGSLAPVLRDEAGRRDGRIRMIDSLPQEWLSWLLSASDLVIIASTHEGLPTVALESIAVGTPVVGTRVGILPELIQPGRNGLLVGERDDLPDAMEKALYRMEWDKSTCRATAEPYGWDNVGRSITEVYHALSA